MAPLTNNQQDIFFPPITAYTQDPVTSGWSVKISSLAIHVRKDSATEATPPEPAIKPSRRLSQLPKARPQIGISPKKQVLVQKQRTLSDGQWWLGLSGPRAQVVAARHAKSDREIPRAGRRETRSSIATSNGSDHRNNMSDSIDETALIQFSSPSSTESDGSSPQKKTRNYSSDNTASPTTPYTAEGGSVWGYDCNSSLIDGSLATPYDSKISPQQRLNRMIRKGDRDTLPADLEDGGFTAYELSLGITHAYSLLQDQVIRRAQVKVQLLEVGWQPGENEWVEEWHALRFKGVRDLVAEDGFCAWATEDAQQAIHTLVQKRLAVAKGIEELWEKLREQRKWHERHEQVAVAAKPEGEYLKGWVDCLTMAVAVGLVYVGFLLD